LTFYVDREHSYHNLSITEVTFFGEDLDLSD